MVAALVGAGCTGPLDGPRNERTYPGLAMAPSCASLDLSADREQMQVGDLVTLRVSFTGCPAVDGCAPAFAPRVDFAGRLWTAGEGAAVEGAGCVAIERAEAWNDSWSGPSWEPVDLTLVGPVDGERAWVWNGTFLDCRFETCYHRPAPPGNYTFVSRADAVSDVASIEVLPRPGDPAVKEGPPCVDVKLMGPTSPLRPGEGAAVTLRIENCGDAPLDVATPCASPGWEPRLSVDGQEWFLQTEGPARGAPACLAAIGHWSVAPRSAHEETFLWDGTLASDELSRRAPPATYALTSIVLGWMADETHEPVRWEAHSSIMVG